LLILFLKFIALSLHVKGFPPPTPPIGRYQTASYLQHLRNNKSIKKVLVTGDEDLAVLADIYNELNLSMSSNEDPHDAIFVHIKEKYRFIHNATRATEVHKLTGQRNRLFEEKAAFLKAQGYQAEIIAGGIWAVPSKNLR